MGRAKWKGPYIKEKNLKALEELRKNYIKPTISRNTEILPKFVEQSFEVYNGKKYIEVLVTEDMIGHKFGEFVRTREVFEYKKKKKKKKKK